MLSFGAFPDEILIKILKDLINSKNFPNSLISFSQTNKRMNKIAQDSPLWHKALSFYFPFVKSAPFDNCSAQFKSRFEQASYLLKRYNLTFSNYGDFLVNNHEQSKQSEAILIGLCIACGQKGTFSPTQLLLARNYSLLFSVALNNFEAFINTLNNPPQPTNEFKRSALILAAEFGYYTLCNHLLTNVNAALDRTTICEAFLKSCENDHFSLVQLFLNPPIINTVKFSLTKALNIACAKGYINIVAILLSTDQLKNNQLALNEAIKIVVANAQLPSLRLLLQEPKIKRNLLLIIELFKNAVSNKNNEMIALILENQEITFSLTLLLESIKQAINNEDIDSAQTILKSKINRIPSYARRNLLYSACEKGLLSLIVILIDNDANLLNKYTLEQALKLAQTKSNQHVVQYLQSRNILSSKSNPSFTLSHLEQNMEQQFATLTIAEPNLDNNENLYLIQYGAKRDASKVEQAIDALPSLRKQNVTTHEIKF